MKKLSVQQRCEIVFERMFRYEKDIKKLKNRKLKLLDGLTINQYEKYVNKMLYPPETKRQKKIIKMIVTGN